VEAPSDGAIYKYSAMKPLRENYEADVQHF